MDRGYHLFATLPHNGLQIPPEAYWLRSLPGRVLLCDVDLFVGELYGSVLKRFSIPSIIFPWHRYAMDVNRRPEDKTLSIVQGASKTQLKDISTGIHWKKTTKGDILIKNPIPLSVHQTLVRKYFLPFHRKIERQFQKGERKNHSVYHIDLHSMPSQGTALHRDPGEKRPHVVISDREGASASKNFIDVVTRAFEAQDLKVSLNWPYKGGRITQIYGNPAKQRHTVQIELNRSLYMNEKTFKKTKAFVSLQQKLEKVLHFIKNNLGYQ